MSNTINFDGIDLSDPAMAAIVARLQAAESENEALKAKSQRTATVTVKSSALLGEKAKDGSDGKGTVGIYGLGRYPISAYANQWAKMLHSGVSLVDYVVANADRLGFKDAAQRDATVKFLQAARVHLAAIGELSLD